MNTKLIPLFFCTFFFAFLSSAQQKINGTIQHDQLQREYILYIPASYNSDTAVPLLFCFHGYRSSAKVNMNYTKFTAIADTAGFILVHPQGTMLEGQSHWNVGSWTTSSTPDDIGFTRTLLDSLSRAYNIDSTRVYSTGMSNGGYMSFLLACKMSDKIAAIASVTGSMSPETYNSYNPQHPTPVLQIHGDADKTVPYEGALWTKSIGDVLEYWVSANNCNTQPTITDIENTNTSDGSTVKHIVYDGGDRGSNTEHFKVVGGDHDWPGSWGNKDLNASIEVWKFLSRYDINGLRGGLSGVQGFDKQNIHIYPNPTQSWITIEGDTQEKHYELLSISGQQLAIGTLTSNGQQIDLSHLAPEVYVLKIGSQTFKIVKTE